MWNHLQIDYHEYNINDVLDTSMIDNVLFWIQFFLNICDKVIARNFNGRLKQLNNAINCDFFKRQNDR